MNKLNAFIKKHGYKAYPLLFAFFPLLSFYGANAVEVRSGNFQISIFLVFNLIVGCVSWALAFILTRNAKKASILSVVFLVLFFMFGRVHNQIGHMNIPNPITPFGPTKILLTLSIIVIFLAWLVVRKLSAKRVEKINFAFSVLGLVLLCTSLISIIFPLLSEARSGDTSKNSDPQLATTAQDSNQSKPDVYYILLDGYAREDYLKNNLKYDNHAFIQSLHDKGFYIADKANSNYAHTHFSVPSTFNMKYLNYLSDELGESSKDRTALKKLTQDNEVVNTFKSLGYKHAQIGTQWGWTLNSPQADLEVEAKNNQSSSILGIELDEFSQVYLQTTALKPWVAANIKSDLVARTLGAFERTGEVPKIKEPTFTFTHIVSPHPPYLFDSNGVLDGQTKLELDNHGFSDREPYLEQTTYVNKLTTELIDKILKESDEPPIIIVASDHGPASGPASLPIKGLELNASTKEPLNTTDSNYIKLRMGMLNAYYFPDKNYEKLYQSISPVNSFRLIFNQYFNKKFELLPDNSYFSGNKGAEYKMYDVTSIAQN